MNKKRWELLIIVLAILILIPFPMATLFFFLGREVMCSGGMSQIEWFFRCVILSNGLFTVLAGWVPLLILGSIIGALWKGRKQG